MSISDDEVEAAARAIAVQAHGYDGNWEAYDGFARAALFAAAKVRAIREGDGEALTVYDARVEAVRRAIYDDAPAITFEGQKLTDISILGYQRKIALAALVAALAASPAATGVVKYQCREIGEGGWRDCTKAEYDRLQRDPHHDTREVPVATGGEKE